MEISGHDKKDTRHDFSKIQKAIESAIQDFENGSSVQDKKKAFRQYSNQFERLIEMESPGEEVDEFITNCVIKAKKMKKEIDNPQIRSSVVDMALHTVLSEMMPEKRWEDIIGLNP